MDHEKNTTIVPKTIFKKGNSSSSCIRVLVVDSDQKSLKSLKGMLKESNYKVVAVDKAEKALDILHRKKGGFDLLLAEVNLPLMDGFDLLEIVVKKFEIPVLMMCGENKISISIRALQLGASFIFPKPINKQNVQSMWQHVCNNYVEKLHSLKSSSSKAKTRVVWTSDLHKKFLQAIHISGSDIHNAFPEKIVELMHIKGLTRTHVASHLQKVRLSMKGNVARRNRWNSPNGIYSGNFGVTYDFSASHHKEPQSTVFPNAFSQQMATTLLPENENTIFSSQTLNFKGWPDNEFMNQGTWQHPITIDAGDTLQHLGSTSNYMMPLVADQETKEGFTFEETFQKNEVSPGMPIIKNDNMNVFSADTNVLEFDQASNNYSGISSNYTMPMVSNQGTNGVAPIEETFQIQEGSLGFRILDTDGLEFDQDGINYFANEGNSNSEWSVVLEDVHLNKENYVNASGDFSMNKGGEFNESGMLNNINSNKTPIHDISLIDISTVVNYNYSSDEGKLAMSISEKTENDDSWLKIYNDVAHVSEQGIQSANQKLPGISLEDAITEMQQGDDPMTVEDIEFLRSFL